MLDVGGRYPRVVCYITAIDVNTKQLFSFNVGKSEIIQKMKRVMDKLPVRCAVVSLKGGGYDIV